MPKILNFFDRFHWYGTVHQKKGRSEWRNKSEDKRRERSSKNGSSEENEKIQQILSMAVY